MKSFVVLVLCLTLLACSDRDELPDAFGNFESTAVTISAEVPGRLLSLEAIEGSTLAVGQVVATIECTQFELQRAQLEAQLAVLDDQLTDASIEISVLENERSVLTKEQRRLARLVEAQAATSKSYDDIAGKVAIVNRRIEAVRRSANQKNRAVLAKRAPLRAQIDSVQDQITRCVVVNPIGGTVLTRLAEQFELVGYGRPLYRIADLRQLELRAYVSSPQLSQLTLGQEVDIYIDGRQPNSERRRGRISWISSEAEFTPKTIQTKEERVSLVYAIKLQVDNSDGRLKDGMPAELRFTHSAP